MKKTFSFIIMIVLLLASVLPSAYAIPLETISEEEALSLIKDARAFYRTAVRGYGVTLDYDTNSEFVLQVDVGLGTYFQWTYRLFDESDLPGGSYEGMREYAETIFCKDIASTIYENEPMGIWIDGKEKKFYTPRFYLHENGKLYTTLQVAEFDYVSFSQFSMGDDPLYIYDWLVNFIDGDSQSATYYARARVGAEGESYLAWIPVKFVNTENGWSIDKCVYTDILTDYTAIDVWEKDLVPYEESPSTGDVSGERITVIGAVTLACIIPAACLTIGRRRRSVI